MANRFKSAIRVVEQDFWKCIQIDDLIASHKHIWLNFFENFSSIYIIITLGIICISLFYSKYRKDEDIRDLFYYAVKSKDDLNSRIKSRILSFAGSYSPPWWYSPHLGTLVAFGQDLVVDYESHIVETVDAAFRVDWFPERPTSAEESFKIVMFFPGLGLSSKNVRMNFSSYCTHF